MLLDKLFDLKKFLAKPGKKIDLNDFETDIKRKEITKVQGEQILKFGVEKLSQLQDKLYAHNQYSVLIIFQAMDAAGKDGAIKHVMSGLNPQGVNVHSFKAPNSYELDHTYLWRHYVALPARGEITIFNRSHYENVLITKVHPEIIVENENLPHINSLKDLDKKFWEGRYKEIRNFERGLTENGTIVIKFFLHVSKDEQKKRFIERIDDPHKNWKFALSDINERKYWNQYQKAYSEAISATSTDEAPWYIVPADDKWFTRLIISFVIHKHFEKMSLSYPKVSAKQKAELLKAKEMLLKEKS
jgi:PPK2 family polyphosphate:nucleotide phosphotransferase